MAANETGGEGMYLGLNIGGTNCSVVVGDAAGNVVRRRQWASEAQRGPAAMIGDLVTEGRKLADQTAGGVRAIGVAIGGPLDMDRGIVLSPPNLPGWDRIPLKEQLEREFAVEVRVEHDAAACALAEHRWGAGRGSQRLAYLTCATGFGVGLVFDGKAYHGARGRSPEIGHVRYRDDGPEAFGCRGSFEGYGSATSLGRLATWRFPERFAAGSVSPAEVGRLAAAGDAEAREVVALNVRAVGAACAIVGDLLFVDMILLGSLARYMGAEWVDRVRAVFRELVQADVAEVCRVESAGLGDRLQDLSAVAAAMG